MVLCRSCSRVVVCCIGILVVVGCIIARLGGLYGGGVLQWWYDRLAL